jgi:hypothetical protein
MNLRSVCDGAMRMLATRGHNLVKANEYARAKIDCEAALGEMLRQSGIGPGNPQWSPGGTNGVQLSEIGINKNQSSRWQLIAANVEIVPAAVEALVAPPRSRRASCPSTASCAEFAENVDRDDFTPSEMVAIGEAVEPLLRAQAKERQAAAGPTTGKGKKASASGKFPEAVKGQVRDHIARYCGFSRHTYERAKAIVTAAEPERFAPWSRCRVETRRLASLSASPQPTSRRRQQSSCWQLFARADDELFRAAVEGVVLGNGNPPLYGIDVH